MSGDVRIDIDSSKISAKHDKDTIEVYRNGIIKRIFEVAISPYQSMRASDLRIITREDAEWLFENISKYDESEAYVILRGAYYLAK